MTPQIIIPAGIHNSADGSLGRLKKGQQYRDLSTVILVPTMKPVWPKPLGAWMNLIRPMNQRVVGPVFLANMEVAAAYEAGVEMVLAQFPTYRYILTLEHDNMPPPMGLLQLYEAIEGAVDGVQYDSVGGLYWTKGELGQPMVYGDLNDPILNFRPQIPKPDIVQPCNGVGMGFTLFRLDLFRRLPRPWFETLSIPGALYTQDLYFYEKARKAGAKVAVDTRCRVGHYDAETDTIW